MLANHQLVERPRVRGSLLLLMYDYLLRGIIKHSFPIWQSLGFHVTRNHFYEPIPDTRTLKQDLWRKSSRLAGVDLNEAQQLRLLELFSAKYKLEYEQFPMDAPAAQHGFYVNNGNFLGVDAEVLYCMVREFKPWRIVEIGSGYSTCLLARAIRRNQEDDLRCRCDLVAIDPFPHKVLDGGLPELTGLIQKNVEDIPVSFFADLGDRDILFIDSSHVLRIGSDVQYEYLEILPSLQKGVLIHVHDIFLPAEYPKEWVLKRHRFWNEQYLLQAFLAFNHSFAVLWAGSYLHQKYPDRLEAAFRTYNRREEWRGRAWMPSSFWIRRTE